MKFKKLLSFTLSLTMLITCLFSFSGVSYATLVGTEKATVGFIPMKESGSGYTEMSTEEISNLTAGDRFFIGIKAEKFTNIQEMEDGLYQIAIGLSYNSEYIEAEPGVRIPNSNNLGNAVLGRSETALLNGDIYSVTSASTGHLDADDANMNCYYIVFQAPDGYESDWAKCENDGYLAFLEFKIKDGITVPDNGVTAFMMTKSPNHYLLQTGTAGKFSLNGDKGGSIYIGTHIDYDISALDLWPVMYTLTFDDNAPEGITVDADTSVNGRTQSVQHDMSVKDYAQDGLILGGDVPKAAGSGKAVSGWAEDPEGTKPFTVDTLVTTDMAIYAQWTDSYEIAFNPGHGQIDGASTPVTIEKATGAALVADDIPASSRVTPPEGYNFLKWNTQENGGGDDVTAGYVVKGAVTAYANYQAIEPDPEDPENPTPLEDAITVHFDANGGTGVKPTTVYVASSGAIQDVGGFPNQPERENYTFDGWYTTALKTEANDNEVLESTIINTLTDGSEVTLYAHWSIDDELVDPSDQITVTFYDNVKKNAQKVIGTAEVVRNEPIGDLSLIVTRGGFDFEEWHKTDGTPVVLNVTPITEDDLALYAIWSTDNLEFEFTADSAVQDYSNTAKNVTVSSINSNNVNIIADLERDVDYEITFYAEGDDVNPIPPIDVGSYAIYVSMLAAGGVNADIFPEDFTWNPADLEIVGKPLAITLAEGAEQVVKTNGKDPVELQFAVANAEEQGFEVTGDDFTVKYFSWVDANGDNVADAGEVTELLGESGTTPSAFGKYIVSVSMKEENFRVGSLVDIETCTLAEDEAIINLLGNQVGNNVVFELVKSVSLDGLTVQTVDEENVTSSGVLYSAIPLEDDNRVDFNKDTKEYYTQVPADDKLQFVMTGTLPEDEISVTIGGNAADITVTTEAGIDGQVIMTITVNDTLTPTEGTGTANDFNNEIIIGIGDDDQYKFNVRKNVTAEILLAPGNSPYGLIERMAVKYHGAEGAWGEEEIAAAKAAFDTDNMFVEGYVPDSQVANVAFSPRAWVGYDTTGKEEDIANPEINLDRNSLVQFIYDAASFHDAGFEAHYLDGTPVADSDITRTITVAAMVDAGYLNMADASDTLYTIEGDSDGEVTTLSEVHIRPGIYVMQYSFEDKNGDVISKERTIVVLWELGNADLDTLLTAGDASSINNTLENRISPYESLSEAGQNLFIYRIMDADRDAILSAGDASRVNNTLENRSSMNAFYSNL